VSEPVVVISGGGTGIGRATARLLALSGSQVLILGRRPETLDRAVQEIEAETRPGAITSMAADVSNPDAVTAVAEHVAATYGTIDAIVNNAGGAGGRPGTSLADIAQSWRDAYEQNVLTAVLLTTALAPYLRRPGGRIVLVSSMSSRSGGAGGPYGSAKAALNGWVLALTAQYAREGITANVVAPGYIPGTELSPTGMPQEILDRIVSRIAAGRVGSADEVAEVIRFLVSPEASWVTSQVIELQGGLLPPNM
jgi:3-oxoacyl-[acyl-carrier protein] reductase